MVPRDIIYCPIVTEQSMAAMDNRKTTFVLAIHATCPLLRMPVVQIFGVCVVNVNIANVRGCCCRLRRTVRKPRRRRCALVA